MAVQEREIGGKEVGSPSRNNGATFWGDLERRRPTKRQTTVRPFDIVRDWTDAPKIKKTSRENNPGSLQSRHISSGPEPSNISPISTLQLHEPISFRDVHPLSSTCNDEINASPEQGPVVCQSSLESSLPGGAEVTSLLRLSKISSKDTKAFTQNNADKVSTKTVNGDNNENDKMILVEEHTPEHNLSTPLTDLRSGPQPKKVHKPLKRKVVTFNIDENKDNVDEVETSDKENDYKDHNFVRIFNADRGRKRSVTDITDLDVILTNIEEIILELKDDLNSCECKKILREAFIQLRQTFSDSIDIYKEKKYLKSALTKTNSMLKKMKQELAKLQAQRTRTQNKLKKLKSEYEELEVQRKGKEEANSFLTEFENLQHKLRKSKNADKEKGPSESLPLLLTEACGYLSTHHQMKGINDKLQQWLDKNNSKSKNT